jgi:diguanylate cyclase (GGDEF)-like protein/PAS domain S-box-containing protein
VSTLQAGQIYEDTLRLQHVDGDWRHFYFRTAALEQEGDQVELGVVVARDITEVIRTQQNLLEQERQYRLLADNFTDIIVTTDKALKQEYVSPSLEKVLGYHPDEICGMEHKQFLRLLGLQDIQQELSEDYQNALGKKPHSRDVGGEYLWVLERDVNAKDGRSVPLELKISLLKGVYNELQGIMILCRDISERRRVQADLKLAAKVFENSLEGIYITDAFGKISQVNRSFIQATGYSEEQAIGQRPAFLSSGWHGQYFANEIRPLLQQSGYWEGELINRRASGEVFPAWVGITEVRSQESELLGYITSFRDITETKTNEERIRKLAYFDPLTELPNRSLFHDRLNQSLQRAQRNQSNFALLFLDLDRFKAINDSMGHEVGDQLLREVAQRLQYCIRNDDTVARMGGDEFTIILSALSDRDAAESASVQVSLKIMNALSKPFFLEGCELYISTSIGIALYPFDGEEETALLKNADTAMYHAKDLGKNGYQFYTEAMNSRSLERLEFQNSLHRAVANDEFELVFQPIYNLRDHTLVGIEALLRWQHPGKGEIQPEDFMPVAKETGLIVQIGEWAIRKACKQMATWLSIGCKVERIAVNVSALQFTDGNLIRTIIDAIDESGISPNQLELEVTESVLMEDFGFSQSMLQDLKVLGVRISVDDFGTGSSSLNYLKKLPLDCLKIDQSFVENIHLSADDRRIAQAIIALAKSFNLKVVAEGLEGPLQANCVLDMGCEEGQGFLLGRPQPVRQMTSLLLSLG